MKAILLKTILCAIITRPIPACADGVIIESHLRTLFGTENSVPTPLSSDESQFNYVARLQDDGRALIMEFQELSGTFRGKLYRVNIDGTFDPSFVPELNCAPPSGSCSYTYSAGFGGSYYKPFWVDPEGRIIVQGSNPETGFGLVRLLPNGARDQTFVSAVPQEQSTTSILFQPDGHMFLAGDFGVWRLNVNGSRDTNFNVVLDQQSPLIALQADGRILVAGTFTNVNGVSKSNLVRLDSAGQIDPSFHPPAEIAAPFGPWPVFRMAGNGDILLTRPLQTGSPNEFAPNLIRLKPTGDLDTTFRGPFITQLYAEFADGSWLAGDFDPLVRRLILRIDTNGAVVGAIDGVANIFAIGAPSEDSIQVIRHSDHSDVYPHLEKVDIRVAPDRTSFTTVSFSPGGISHLVLMGGAPFTSLHSLETSTDLKTWTELFQFQLGETNSLSGLSKAKRRFYRVRGFEN